MLKTFLSGASAGKEIVLNFEGKNSLHIEMKQIEVVAAIICREGSILPPSAAMVSLRTTGSFPAER